MNTFLRDLFHEASHPPNQVFDVREYKESFAIVIFRPTEGRWTDWMWNLFTVPFGRIHSGFGVLYTSLAGRVEKVLQILDRKRGRKLPVIFTGFSRGGALAEMCAVDPLFSPWEVQAVSFGAPRWTTKKIRTENVTRVCIGGDPVCRVPPWPFKQVGKIRWIEKKLFPRFSDHRYSTYRKALEGLRE